MDTEIDLRTADRDVLIGIIVRQQAIIERLEKCIAQLEGQAKPKGSRRMPGLKPKADREPARPKEPRKPRPHGFARARMTPTHRVEHVVEQCPDCGTHLSGGWAQRTREVIDLPQVPAQVTEHVYLARTCLQCRRCRVPKAQLDGVVMGKQRLGGQRHQPDYSPAGGGSAAVAHHPMVPGHRAWAAPQLGRHRKCHTHRGGQSADRTGGHTGAHPRQPSGPRR